MIWGDLLSEHVRSCTQLRRVLAEAFEVDSGDVCVVSDSASLPRSDTVTVACEHSLHGGQFPWRLTIYVFEDTALKSRRRRAQRIAEGLCARCLLPEGDTNPYVMTLITGDKAERVLIDPAKLDQCDEYWLINF